MKPFIYEAPKKRYLSETSSDGEKTWFSTYEGNDRAAAVASCNFWDERQPARFTDRAMEDLVNPYAKFTRKFAALQEHIFADGAEDRQILEAYTRRTGRVL